MFVRLLELPERGPRALRPQLARVRRPRRRAVPGARQAADDRVARAGDPRVLRRHRDRDRRHVRQRGVARARGNRRQAARRRGHPRLRLRTASWSRRARPARSTSGRPSFWPGFTYLGQDDKRREIDRDGYITIGDVGHVDGDGFLYLSDRARDMVISGGVNIYPIEIEACLLELPGVRDVAVFGIPDDAYGEALAAHVDADPAAGLTEDGDPRPRPRRGSPATRCRRSSCSTTSCRARSRGRSSSAGSASATGRTPGAASKKSERCRRVSALRCRPRTGPGATPTGRA